MLNMQRWWHRARQLLVLADDHRGRRVLLAFVLIEVDVHWTAIG